MAIKFAAVTDLVYRLQASGLPSSYPLTWAGFVRVDADSNDVGPVVVRYADGSGTIRQQVLLDSTGASNLLEGEAQTSGGTTTGFAATIGVWYPFTLVVTQASPNVQTDFYVNNVLIGSVASADIADTSSSMAMGSTGANTPKLSLAGVRLWTVALTSPERIAEGASLTPVKTANLWASYQFTSSGTLLTDSSGNGRSLTVSGAPTFTADPVLTVVLGARAYPMYGWGYGDAYEYRLGAATSGTYSVAAAASIATTATSTTTAVLTRAATQAIATGATAAATGVFVVAATQAVTTGHSATAQLTLATTAASSITVGGTAVSASAVAAAASSSVSTGASAVALLAAIASATSAVATTATATNNITAGAAAASSVATGATATSQATTAASATSAITTGGTASALDIGSAAAASSTSTGSTASTQATMAAAASSAIATTATATSATAGGQDAASSIATGSAASTQAVSAAAAASSIATTSSATSQATTAAAAASSVATGGTATTQDTGSAAATSAVTTGGTASIAGGAVYDVSAAEALHITDATTGPGLLHVNATDVVDVGDAATAAASGSTAELEAEILRLRAMLAMASGGADDSANDNSHDAQQRDILRHREALETAAEGERVRIARQNDLIIKLVTATVLHEKEPAS